MHGPSPKVIRMVLHAYVTHFLNLVTGRKVPVSVNSSLTGSILQSSLCLTSGRISIVHEKFFGEITKNKYNKARVTLKDFKPDTFESDEKSKLTFRQRLERIDFETMLKFAGQMHEWD